MNKDAMVHSIQLLEKQNSQLTAERDELKEKQERNRQHRRHFEKLYDAGLGKNIKLSAENALLREALVKLCPAEHSDNCKWNNETSCHCGWFDAEQALNSTPRTVAVTKVLEAAIDDLSEGCDCQVCEAVREMEGK